MFMTLLFSRPSIATNNQDLLERVGEDVLDFVFSFLDVRFTVSSDLLVGELDEF